MGESTKGSVSTDVYGWSSTGLLPQTPDCWPVASMRWVTETRMSVCRRVGTV